MEAFREEVTSNMEAGAGCCHQGQDQRSGHGWFDDNNEVDLPQSLIDQEVDRMRQEAVQQFGGGAQIDPSMLPAEMFSEQAEKRVKLGLIVSAIVDENRS